jgi:hypothetical protein
MYDSRVWTLEWKVIIKGRRQKAEDKRDIRKTRKKSFNLYPSNPP